MTVKELIDKLQDCRNPDAKVRIALRPFIGCTDNLEVRELPSEGAIVLTEVN